MFRFPFYRLKPVEFHPYTSRVTNTVFEIECMGSEDLSRNYKKFQEELLAEFKRAGIKAHRDNKIVFGMSNGETMIYFGFYDWHFAIGLGYWDENEKYYDGAYRGECSYKNATK